MANVLHPDQDWQSRRSVVECNRHMWTNQLACDVTFITRENIRIGAHKYVLGSRSSVFYAMFFGPLSRNTGVEISLPDMDAEQLNGLLQFLYTEDVKVDLNNVLSLLYGAKKYGVQSLIDKCLNNLKRNMVPANVCTVMENAHCYGNNDLKSRCFSLIVQDTKRVFDAEDLAELCNECFISVIKEDGIPVSEEIIFDAVLKFAEGKCERNNLETTPQNLKAMVADVLPHVRFPLMNSDYVVDKVEATGLLTESQLKTLYQYFLRKRPGQNGPDHCDGFNCNKRKCIYTVQRFGEVVSGWGYKRDKCDAISLTCSHDVLLKGIQMYGCCQGAGNLEIILRLVQEPYKANVAIKHAVVETDGKQKIYNVYFDNPAQVKKDKLYSISLVIKGPSTYYGTQGEDIILKDGVTFHFIKSDLSTNNTNPARGQIPGIVYELPPLAHPVAMET